MTPPKKKTTAKKPDASWDDSALTPTDPPEVVATPPDDTPEVEWVTWWDTELARYRGGRHPADATPPDGIEVRPYVNTAALQAWSPDL
jgi:hypothetical protein